MRMFNCKTIGVEFEFFIRSKNVINKPDVTHLSFNIVSTLAYVAEVKIEEWCEISELSAFLPQYCLQLEVVTRLYDISEVEILIQDLLKLREALPLFCQQCNFECILESKPFGRVVGSSMQFNFGIGEVLDIDISLICNNLCGITKENVDIFLPTQNCIDRVCDTNAIEIFRNMPSKLSWGYNNRTCLVRVADGKKYESRSTLTSKELSRNKYTHNGREIAGDRIEYRLASTFADPKLCLDVLVYAINNRKGSLKLLLPEYGNAMFNENLENIL